MNVTPIAAVVPGQKEWVCDACGYVWKVKSRRKALTMAVAIGPAGASPQIASLAREISSTIFCQACFPEADSLFVSLYAAIVEAVKKAAAHG